MAKPDLYKSQFDMDFSNFIVHRKQDYQGREHIPDYFQPDAPFFIRHLLWRRQMNMNSIVLIVGGVRTGKSWTGLKICETYSRFLEKPYDVTKQCTFDILPFLLWSQEQMDNIYMLDEVGVNLNPSEWWSVQSKIFRNFTQTQGFRKNVMILVLPNISFLLKSIRFMCNYVIETRNQGMGFIRKIAMDNSRGRGFLMNIGIIKVTPPSKKTIEKYEEMKKEWNNVHLKEDIDELLRGEQRKAQYKINENNELENYMPQ